MWFSGRCRISDFGGVLQSSDLWWRIGDIWNDNCSDFLLAWTTEILQLKNIWWNFFLQVDVLPSKFRGGGCNHRGCPRLEVYWLNQNQWSQLNWKKAYASVPALPIHSVGGSVITTRCVNTLQTNDHKYIIMAKLQLITSMYWEMTIHLRLDRKHVGAYLADVFHIASLCCCKLIGAGCYGIREDDWRSA